MVGEGKKCIDEQGNEGRGRFEKILILLFSQSPLFSPEDERTERERGGGADRWERKRDDPCHPLILKLQRDYVIHIYPVNACFVLIPK